MSDVEGAVDADEADDADDAALEVADDLDEADDAGGADEDDADGNAVAAPTARSVLEYLVRSVVQEPDGVEVDVFDRRGRASLEVHVAPGDMGRVIGKRGRVAQLIRTVTRAAAVRDGVDVDVEFVE